MIRCQDVLGAYAWIILDWDKDSLHVVFDHEWFAAGEQSSLMEEHPVVRRGIMLFLAPDIR